MSSRKQTALIVAALLLLSAIISRPFFTFAQVGGHSTFVDYIRSVCWHDLVSQGELFPTWIPTFYTGKGSPIFLFYAPLTYMFVEAIRTWVPTTLAAIKIAYVLWILLSVSGMYVFGKKLAGRAGGLVAAAVLGFAPYFLLDIYVRNGFAEFACFSLMPWLFLAALHITENPKSVSLFLFALLLAMLVLTHNITAMITAPLLLAFLVVLGWGKNLPAILAAYGAGVGMSAWFWLPAIREKGLVASAESLTGGYFTYEKHFVYPKQLVWPNWGWQPSIQGPNDDMSLQIGLVILACVATVAVFAVIRKRLLSRTTGKILLLLFGCFAIATLFTTEATAWFWGHLPLLPYVQFPWRFLLLVSFFGASLAAFVPRLVLGDNPIKSHPWLVAALVSALCFAASAGYIKAKYVAYRASNNELVLAWTPKELAQQLEQPDVFTSEDVFVVRNLQVMCTTTTAENDYLPLTVKQHPCGMYYGHIVEAVKGDVEILEKSQVGTQIKFRYSADAPGTVQVVQFYFPGWKAQMGGRRLPVKPGPENGWIQIDVPPGTGEVNVRFGDTPVRTAGKAISIATLLMLGAWLTIRKEKTVKGEG